MLADDATILAVDGGVVTALPGVAEVHLCSGVACDGVALPSWRSIKAPVAFRPAAGRCPLGAVYRLGFSVAEDDVTVRELTGVERFAAFQECVYGPVLASQQAAELTRIAAVMQQCPVFRIDRPAGRWTADEIAEAILRG
jgi:hypothetical protein